MINDSKTKNVNRRNLRLLDLGWISLSFNILSLMTFRTIFLTFMLFILFMALSLDLERILGLLNLVSLHDERDLDLRDLFNFNSSIDVFLSLDLDLLFLDLLNPRVCGLPSYVLIPSYSKRSYGVVSIFYLCELFFLDKQFSYVLSLFALVKAQAQSKITDIAFYALGNFSRLKQDINPKFFVKFKKKNKYWKNC
ncbi:hypothetical protein AGLY_000722 [Aphis glycines]|uniref:Uncharacterized protein n=1 Tax=Aphis glycines TaxID=307491 RepID=A0A6G0U9A3_APHGL|nr:hypothetical protein AGLY_000722 [Aphis glycines]